MKMSHLPYLDTRKHPDGAAWRSAQASACLAGRCCGSDRARPRHARAQAQTRPTRRRCVGSKARAWPGPCVGTGAPSWVALWPTIELGPYACTGALSMAALWAGTTRVVRGPQALLRGCSRAGGCPGFRTLACTPSRHC